MTYFIQIAYATSANVNPFLQLEYKNKKEADSRVRYLQTLPQVDYIEYWKPDGFAIQYSRCKNVSPEQMGICALDRDMCGCIENGTPVNRNGWHKDVHSE